MLHELMDDRRINQSQLGRETGIPQATISRYLNGTTKSLKFDTLKVLAEYFSVPWLPNKKRSITQALS